MFKIVSSRIGTPGDEYQPVDGVNIDALIAGGFIIEVGKPKKPKQDTANIQDNKES